MSDYVSPLPNYPSVNIQHSDQVLEISQENVYNATDQNLNNNSIVEVNITENAEKKPLFLHLNKIFSTLLNPVYFIFFIVLAFFLHLLILYTLKKTASMSYGKTNMILIIIILLSLIYPFYETRRLKYAWQSIDFYMLTSSMLFISILLSFITNYLDFETDIDSPSSLETNI